MKEDFLHFIWQYQQFSKDQLQTTHGEQLAILQQGLYNQNAGPDFLSAKINIEGIDWFGHVEIHLKSSDWNLHQHQNNEAYNSVVLHVVWTDDKPQLREDGSRIPTLELKSRVEINLIEKYKQLQENQEPIACKNSISQVRSITILSMLDKACTQRLERKAQEVLQVLHSLNGDWEETTYRLLGKNFGFKINADAFIELCQSLPYKTLLKHVHQPKQIEALLFGQAGLLTARDEYSDGLLKEYQFLSHKYSLRPRLKEHQWKFLRLRPANFPTIRLAEFASLINTRPKLFTFFIESEPSQIIKALKNIEVNDYWSEHYQFGVPSKRQGKSMGKQSAESILINTVVPLLAAYSLYLDDLSKMEKAEILLQQLRPEQNNIIRLWESAQQKAQTAFDSQALIELYNNYCNPRKCLSCNIGVSLVKPSKI